MEYHIESICVNSVYFNKTHLLPSFSVQRSRGNDSDVRIEEAKRQKDPFFVNLTHIVWHEMAPEIGFPQNDFCPLCVWKY